MSEIDQCLEAKIAQLKIEHQAEKKVIEHIQLPAWAKYSVCRHKGNDSSYFWSVSVSHKDTWKLTMEQALEILKQHCSKILDAPFYKQPYTVKSWAPASANCSKGEPGAEHLGEAQIEIEQYGGVSFTRRSIRFWLEIPDTGFAELCLEVQNLPQGWMLHASYQKFDAASGEPLTVVYRQPSELTGDFRKDFGGKGSWDHRSYWVCAQDFINAIK